MLHKLLQKEYLRLPVALVGTLLYAIGINWFIVPLGLYTGGLLGLCQLVRTLLVEGFGLPAVVDYSGILYLAANVPIFLLAWRALGKGFLLRSLVCTLASSFFLSVIRAPETPYVTESLAGCVVGGILAGFALGLCLTCGCSTGGLDIVGLWLAKRGSNLSVGRFSLGFNAVLYALCAWLFGLGAAVYSVIYTVFCSLFMDRFHEQNISVQVLIFTKVEDDALLHHIISRVGRGVTSWEGKGGYTDSATRVICVCASKYEVSELQAAVREVDPKAFFIVQEGVRISGNFERKLS